MTKQIHSIEKQASKTVIVGFDGDFLSDRLKKQLDEGFWGGIILFKRNIQSAAQTHEMLVRAARHRSHPLLMSVDQEGGRVVRLKNPLTVLPPMRRLGTLGHPETTRRSANLVGQELRAIGFNLNFAPVLDIDTHPDSPVIGDRSFSSSSKPVIEHGLVFGKGLFEGGVIPCAKHFPGHGDAALDSHLSLPIVSHDEPRLRTVEMSPFEAWIAGRIGPIMTAHVVYPALDPNWPSTLSERIIGTLLRKQFHHQGVVFSDDLEMGAMSTFGSIGEVAIRAIEAGIDGLLVCKSEQNRETVINALAKRATDDADFKQRINTSVSRLKSLTIPPPIHPYEWVGTTAHRQVQTELLGMLESDSI